MYLKLCGMHKIFLMVPLPFSCDCCVSCCLIAFFVRFLWMKLFLDTAHHYRTDMSGGYAMDLGFDWDWSWSWTWTCLRFSSLHLLLLLPLMLLLHVLCLLLLCHLLMDFVVWLTWNGIALMYWVECRANPTLHLSDFISKAFKNELQWGQLELKLTKLWIYFELQSNFLRG